MPQRLIDLINAVAIGASAGGIETLTAILPALRRTTNAAIFIVLHLPKDKPSLLASIFAPRCALPVREAGDGEPVEPGTVYFAPPDYHLLLDDGPRLSLSVDNLVHHSRPSIDVLFESAADIYGPRLLGILLSGGNDDGAQGLLRVQRCGGHTVVQQPDTAQVAQMPRAALARMQPDAVLTPHAIAELLRALPQRPPLSPASR